MYAWMVPCILRLRPAYMLGWCPICLDGVLHAWMGPCLYAWMVSCMLAWGPASLDGAQPVYMEGALYVTHLQAPLCASRSGDSRQKTRKPQCTTSHNIGSNPLFAAYRAGALSTGPRCQKKMKILCRLLDWNRLPAVSADGAATHSATEDLVSLYSNSCYT